MPEKKHTSDELRRASNHLWYEMGMFQGLVLGMGSGIAGEGNVLSNSLVESFAIHVRVLIHFFYTEIPHKDDVLAVHFFHESEDWNKHRPLETEILEVAKTRADKEVAHLTYLRLKVTPEMKTWNFKDIFNDLQRVLDKFIELVPRDNMGDVWDDTIRALNGDSEAADD